MINKSVIKTIGSQEMDRKDFLKYSGLVLLSLVGLKTIINVLNQSENKYTANNSNQKATNGFGGGRYGD